MKAVSFVLVNESTTTDLALGGELTPVVLQQIASAIELQLNTDVADEWGGVYAVRVDTSEANAHEDEIPILIKDSLPEAPGAAGYHATTPTGQPVIYVGRDGSNSLIIGGQALSVTISHECCEAAGDPGANRWADDGAGSEFALELCDAVESFYYQIAGVCVSDFVTQNFFVPGAPGPYSRTKAATAALTTATANGGDYQIVRAVNESGAQQVTAKGTIAPHRLARKRHPMSRSFRRGLRP